MKTAKFLLAVFPLLFGFAVSQASAEGLFSATVLKSALAEANKGLPVMIDQDTRMDRIEAGHDEAVYFFTLVNHTYDQFDWKLVTANVLAGAKPNYCTNPDMALFKNGHISMLYIYYDKNGELAGTVKIPSTICDE